MVAIWILGLEGGSGSQDASCLISQNGLLIACFLLCEHAGFLRLSSGTTRLSDRNPSRGRRNQACSGWASDALQSAAFTGWSTAGAYQERVSIMDLLGRDQA